jgi:hypothetical protein
MPRETTKIRDRATITDHVSDVMHQHFCDTSIDRLLTRPFEAMALAVAAKSGRLKRPAAKYIATQIDELVAREPAAVEAINEICRRALASRKRGHLKRKDVA